MFEVMLWLVVFEEKVHAKKTKKNNERVNTDPTKKTLYEKTSNLRVTYMKNFKLKSPCIKNVIP